jgi:hypothetical protein
VSVFEVICRQTYSFEFVEVGVTTVGATYGLPVLVSIVFPAVGATFAVVLEVVGTTVALFFASTALICACEYQAASALSTFA